jgi:hypothetical protein
MPDDEAAKSSFTALEASPVCSCQLGAPDDMYFSGDVEADGPVPGPYSMLSFGLAVAASYDGAALAPSDPTACNFYAELQPISDMYDEGALAVSGLDRAALAREGRAPSEAMSEAADWVRAQAGEKRPVFVGFPAVYDWMFLYWYFTQFSTSGSPFDFSACLDMKTMYQQKARVVTAEAGLDDLPPFLRSERPHTHNARDDAIQQADIFVRLFEWRGH